MKCMLIAGPMESGAAASDKLLTEICARWTESGCTADFQLLIVDEGMKGSKESGAVWGGGGGGDRGEGAPVSLHVNERW